MGTSDRATALRLLHAKAEASIQPVINLQIARAYLAANDPLISTRTWQYVMEEMVKLKHDVTQRRWRVAIKDKAFDGLRKVTLLETRPEHLLRAMQLGKVSTNVYLRCLHNFALDMSWLPWPVIPKKQWPKVHYKDKRAITWEEHQAIVAREQNPERKAFYLLAWHTGASQTDLAQLDHESIDWENRVITFNRQKTGTPVLLSFDEETIALLRTLPISGLLFPYLRTVRAGCLIQRLNSSLQL